MNERTQTPWWRTRTGLVLCGFLIVSGFFLVTEHGHGHCAHRHDDAAGKGDAR